MARSASKPATLPTKQTDQSAKRPYQTPTLRKLDMMTVLTRAGGRIIPGDTPLSGGPSV